MKDTEKAILLQEIEQKDREIGQLKEALDKMIKAFDNLCKSFEPQREDEAKGKCVIIPLRKER